MTLQKLCSKCKFKHEGCNQVICEPLKTVSNLSADTVEIVSKFHSGSLYIRELDDWCEFAQEYFASKYVWLEEGQQ